MDWICDECMKHESEVGTLSSGRTKDGVDWQLCKDCYDALGYDKKDGIKIIAT
jgi:hypothetical protein